MTEQNRPATAAYAGAALGVSIDAMKKVTFVARHERIALHACIPLASFSDSNPSHSPDEAERDLGFESVFFSIS
jgi:hypothetical protein